MHAFPFSIFHDSVFSLLTTIKQPSLLANLNVLFKNFSHNSRFHWWDNEIYFILNIIYSMITPCMWYVCLFPLEGNYIEFIKFLQVPWKQLYRKQILLVRNKLSLTHCIHLVIIFSFLPFLHTCSSPTHAGR